jgi:iron complex outermembrane recepter protein
MSTESFRREWLRLRARQMMTASAVLALPLLGSAAMAADEADVLEEVVVTGSSIKGAAPVGSAIVTVGRENLEEIGAQTVQQVLKTVPAVVGLNSTGQGSYGSFDGAGTNAPTIHGLGASASNSTLILINGHRLPLSGLNHTLADPNILAPAALERVEVLADGASSVYGSDAVAGVINFITRRKYEGVEVSAQKGWGDSYDTQSVSFLGGKTWDGGSALVSYAYSDRSALNASDRPYTRADHRGQGGSNFANFFCAPATVAPAGQSNIFYAPYSGAGVANNSANATCDYSGVADLVPQEKRHSVFVSIEQSINDKLDVSADFIYSRRDNRQNVARGNVQATIFGAGHADATRAANPFFQVPAGSTATSATVRFQADELLGAGAHVDGQAETFYTMVKADYELNDNWSAEVGTVQGRDNTFQKNYGQLCVSCAYQALNGTLNGSGTGTATALTAATALDVFNTGSTNRTSQAVRDKLTDSLQTRTGDQTINNVWATLNGSLFALPGGDVRAAIGAEYIRYTLKQDNTLLTNTGPASTGGTRHEYLTYERDVQSAFVEVLLPLVGVEQGITGVRKLDVNVSGRVDEYSDFGSTSNPKLAVNWEIADGFKARANWGKSFVAPALTSRGNAQGITGESAFGGYGLGAMNVPVAIFPTVTGIPGCTTATVTCTLGTTITGAQITGGNGNLKPQKGESWGVGFDWLPAFADGLSLSATYWNNELTGGITAPVPALALNTAALSSLLQLYPAGATPAQLAAARGALPPGGALPPNVYFIYNYQQANVLNLDIAGIDVDARYVMNTDAGKFNIGAGVTRKVKFDQSIGTGGQVFSVLGTAGFNTTFPSLKLEGRANLGWENGAMSADVFLNYTDSYRNWSGGTVAPVVRTNGVPSGGGDKVESMTIVDVNLSYKLSGRLEGSTVFLDATNLFDKDPSFYNSANGYDNINASPIGRVITVGLRAKL